MATGDDAFVEFYEKEERLVEDVVQFANEGLSSGEAVLMVATPPHRAAIERALAGRGFDVEQGKKESRLLVEDAAATLERCLVDGRPDEARFTEVLDGLLARAGPRKLRVYGELVNVLWQAGDRASALRLDELWCAAVKDRKLPLFCGYLVEGFSTAEDLAAFRARHSKSAPVGSAQVIAELEQRARALEVEVMTRRALAEELKLANLRKDEFLAMLAHELRNPLAALSVGLALRDKLETQDAGLERLKESCSRQVKNLTHLVDDLLDVSRFTTGKAEVRLRKASVDLSAIVQNAAQLSRPMIEARKHEFAFTVAPGTFAMMADPMRMEQIISNLLHNAAKFTHPGGHVGLRLRQANGVAIIEVTDDGVGIPADMLPRVFELFTQVDPGIDRTGGGLGIGLTLARRLAELHGGELTVESAGLGKGSKFTLKVPLNPVAAVEAPAPIVQAALPTSPHRRVLLIEDNEDIRESLKELLEDLGHEVQTAVDGPSGLKKLLEMQPDVALVDVGLPGMDGYEVARQARATNEGRGIYLVALTGYSGYDARRQAEQAGFDRHVVKPLKFEDLSGLMHAQNSARLFVH